MQRSVSMAPPVSACRNIVEVVNSVDRKRQAFTAFDDREIATVILDNREVDDFCLADACLEGKVRRRIIHPSPHESQQAVNVPRSPRRRGKTYRSKALASAAHDGGCDAATCPTSMRLVGAPSIAFGTRVGVAILRRNTSTIDQLSCAAKKSVKAAMVV